MRKSSPGGEDLGEGERQTQIKLVQRPPSSRPSPHGEGATRSASVANPPPGLARRLTAELEARFWRFFAVFPVADAFLSNFESKNPVLCRFWPQIHLIKSLQEFLKSF